MSQDETKDVGQIMLDTDLVEHALREAGIKALMRHKRLGTPIVVWRDGKVVWIPAEEIEIPGGLE
ncbi:MAG: hypothetical protein ACLQGP_21495 [Isosphaeraceae bacterium]